MKKPYPKAFEKYWYASSGPLLVNLLWSHSGVAKIKHQSYLSWQAGRKYQDQFRQDQLDKNNARIVYYG